MKILSVTTSTPNDSAAWWRISNIIKILKSNGHEVDVVHYLRRSSYESSENKEQPNKNFFVITPIIHIRHMKILFSDNYDLVYGNECIAIFCSVLGKLGRIPLIFDMHGGHVEEFLLKSQSNPRWKYSAKIFEFFLDWIIYFVALHFSNRIICVSNRMIQYLHNEKRIPLEKMTYVTNGVDLEFFKLTNDEKIENMRNWLGLEDKLVFGYIGRFQKWQGVENFIEAARKNKDREIAFLIVGGEEPKENNIIFIPKVPRTQIPDYYSICDVLVLPRPSHPATEMAAPTKFAEYAAMGKPILTTNVGDAADFVRKYKCGIVVENNEPENLMIGINEFKSKSESELKRMGKNSRVLAENEFDWNKVKIELLRAIESLK